jgi:plasmid rolling circle replication initiator protein Rep
MSYFNKDSRELPLEKWYKKKHVSLLLSESLYRLELDRLAERVASCGSYLVFHECPNGHERRLRRANFCMNRLCSTCNWRKSLATYHQTYEIAHEALKRQPDLSFIFLTLTIRNVTEDKLSDAITQLLEAFNRFMQLRGWKRYITGWMRSLEVTRNHSKGSKYYGTYHPHFHILIAVPPGYFKSGYKKKKDIQQLWKDSLRINYDPVIDVRKVKPKKPEDEEEFEEVQVKDENPIIAGAVAEISKYTVKDTEYINEQDDDWTDSSVLTLTKSLRGRRLIAYGGVFKQIKKELGIKDVENTDLVNITGDSSCTCSLCQSDFMDIAYKWLGNKWVGKEIDFNDVLARERRIHLRQKVKRLLEKPLDFELTEDKPFVITDEKRRDMQERLDYYKIATARAPEVHAVREIQMLRNELENWVNMQPGKFDDHCLLAASPQRGEQIIEALDEFERLFGDGKDKEKP